MADIKQAAKWMQEGKKVRRPEWPPEDLPVAEFLGIVCFLDHEGTFTKAQIFSDDLLADDWEVAP